MAGLFTRRRFLAALPLPLVPRPALASLQAPALGAATAITYLCRNVFDTGQTKSLRAKT